MAQSKASTDVPQARSDVSLAPASSQLVAQYGEPGYVPPHLRPRRVAIVEPVVSAGVGMNEDVLRNKQPDVRPPQRRYPKELKSIKSPLDETPVDGFARSTEQHRMEHGLLEWVNNYFYKGKLTTAKSILQGRPGFINLRDALSPSLVLPGLIPAQDAIEPSATANILGTNDIFFDVVNGLSVEDINRSSENVAESMCVMSILQVLLNQAKVAPRDIMVISPYSAQVFLLRHLLSRTNMGNINVQTIDASQGKEANIVIVTLARANGRPGFLDQESRLNVALTRARFARYVVGNASFFLNSRRMLAIKQFAYFMLVCDKLQSVSVSGAPENVLYSRGWGRERCEEIMELAPLTKKQMQAICPDLGDYWRTHDATENN